MEREAYGPDALVTGPGAPARGVCRAPPGVLGSMIINLYVRREAKEDIHAYS